MALAVVCAYATEETLQKCGCYQLIRAAAIISLVAGLAGLVILAIIRGNILGL
jgi:hypothetical protein